MNESDFNIGDFVTQNELFYEFYQGPKFTRKIIGRQPSPPGITDKFYLVLDQEVEFKLTGYPNSPWSSTKKSNSISAMWIKIDLLYLRKQKLMKINEKNWLELANK